MTVSVTHTLYTVPAPGAPFTLETHDRVAFGTAGNVCDYFVSCAHLSNNRGSNADALDFITEICGQDVYAIGCTQYGLNSEGAWPTGPLAQQARFLQRLFELLRTHHTAPMRARLVKTSRYLLYTKKRN